MSKYIHAARLLWEPIPFPARKPAVDRKSWKTLEAGRELRLLTKWFDGSRYWELGELFEVTLPTTQGITLKCLHTPEWSRKWSQDWKGTFEKVRKKPKKHKKKSEDI